MEPLFWILVGALAFFVGSVAGFYTSAARIPRTIASMTADQIRQLAEKVGKERNS